MQSVTTFSTGVIFSEMGGGSGPTVHFVYCDLVGRPLSSVHLKSRKRSSLSTYIEKHYMYCRP